MKTQVGVEKKINVRQMAIIGMLSAISIMLSMTPLGFIPIGPVNTTIMHIPVIIGSIIEGPMVGGILGLIFGLTSFMRAITTPSPTNFMFMNPIVSILPRVLMGIATYYIYKSVFKVTKNLSASGLCSGFLGSIINTVGVLGLVYLLYAQRYVEAIGGDTSTAGAVILGIAATNGIPEAIVGALVVSGVVIILKKSKK